MNMFLKLLEWVFAVGILGILAYMVTIVIKNLAHATPDAVSTGGTRKETPMTLNARSAAPANPLAGASMKCVNLPLTVTAGRILMDVPSLVPGHGGSGWTERRYVMAGFQVKAPFDGPDEVYDVVELDGGYLLLGRSNDAYLLQQLPLTPAEEKRLNDERKQALDQNDSGIRDFKGTNWDLQSIAGEFQGRACTIRAVTVTPDPKDKVTLVRCSDGRAHNYFDLHAYSANGDGWLYAFYVDGVWSAYVGRKLDSMDVNRIKAL